MSCTKFYFRNLALDAVITPSTENAQFPASNIADARRSKVFRSTTNSDHIYFDFGAAESIDSFFMVGHTFDGLGIVTASLELNNVATWTSGAPVTIPITIDTENDMAFGDVGTPGNYRYAKLIITSTLGYCEIGKIFIGLGSDLGTENDFQYPLSIKFSNNSTIQRNRYGQKFIDEIREQKIFGGEMRSMTNDEVEEIHDLARQCSTTKPFFMRISNVNVFNDTDRLSGYYYLRDEPEFTFDRGGYWSVKLGLEEGM
jgi:hypothetical protein